MQGYQGKIVDRKHLKHLGTTDKGKMTQLGMNQRCSGAKMGDFPVGKSDTMVVGGGDRRDQGINGETELGKQNPVGNVKRSPLKFRSNGSIHGYGKKRPVLAAVGLTIEVNREGKRRVVWRSYKGDLRSSIWVKRDQREQVVSTPRGSWVHTNPEMFKGGLRHSKGVTLKDYVVGPSRSPQVHLFFEVGSDNEWALRESNNMQTVDLSVGLSEKTKLTQPGRSLTMLSDVTSSSPSPCIMGEPSATKAAVSSVTLRSPTPFKEVADRQVESPTSSDTLSGSDGGWWLRLGWANLRRSHGASEASDGG